MNYVYAEWNNALEIAEENNFDVNEIGEDYPLAVWISELVQDGDASTLGPNAVEAVLSLLGGPRGTDSFSEDDIVRALGGHQGETGDDFTEMSEEYVKEEGGDFALGVLTSAAKQNEWSDGDYESWYLANVHPDWTYMADSEGSLHWFTKSVIKG